MVTAGFTPESASGSPTASPVATPATAAFSPGVRFEQPLSASDAATGRHSKRTGIDEIFMEEKLGIDF
jgi:hypothetical protein